MGLHDFRRAAATFLAMDAPEKIGLIPGVLQHASPEVSDRHYNLARSMQAGQRFAAHVAKARSRLRLFATKPLTGPALNHTPPSGEDKPRSQGQLTGTTTMSSDMTNQERDRGE